MNNNARHHSILVTLARAFYLIRTRKFREFFSAFTRKLKSSNSSEYEQYQKWIHKNEPDESAQTELKRWCTRLEHPLITFILRNCANAELFERTLQTIREQYSEKWELLVSGTSASIVTASNGDTRIRFVPDSEISRNINGMWIIPISEGDTIVPFALAEVLRTLNNKPELDFIYSDHDLSDAQGNRTQPFFKPHWSPEFLSDFSYTGRLAVYRASVVKDDPLFWNNEQNWLKSFAFRQLNVIRIPKVLYHYSSQPQFSSGHDFNRISDQPSISILIPTRDKPGVLQRAVSSILIKSTYRKFEVLILNNSSSKKETLRFFDELRKEQQIRILDYPQAFNFSAINNFGVRKTDFEYIVFLNDDTEVITPSWLEAMLYYAERDQIGAVGAKLLYRNNSIQHAGILVGLPQIAVHAHRGFSRDSEGYNGRLAYAQNYSAVTGACMMVRRNRFLEIGGFDENLPSAYNDVDFCLRLISRGNRVVWTPRAELYHDESSSRGYEATLEKQKRLAGETNYFLQRWKDVLEKGDPYYNPNLSLEDGAFRILV